MATPKKHARRTAYRRGADTKWQVWWPVLFQLGAMMLAVVGLYYGITQKQAVQAALFDERTTNFKDQLDSLQRNVEGLQRYIVELHNQEDRPRR